MLYNFETMLLLLFNLSFQYNEDVIKLLPPLPDDGYPQLPYDFRLIEIPYNAENVKIVNVNFSKRLYKENAQLIFNDKIQYFDENGELITISIPRIQISSKFPQNPVELKTIGYMRDKKYALVHIYPLIYENGNLYLIDNISFDVQYNQSQTTYSVKPLPDSIDYLILTISQFKEPFDSIANLSIIRGFRTMVVYVDSIKDNPQKIRDLIKWAYRTLGIKYVLIGTDATIIKPWRFKLSFYDSSPDLPTGPDVHTDYPYAALDGDFISGYNWYIGDSMVDPYPDIGIARLPATDKYQVFNYYNKLKTWTFNWTGDTGALACLESNLDADPNSFYWLCENSAVSVSNLPRIIRLYQIYFDTLKTGYVFDSLNLNLPQFFFYMGHANGFIIASHYPGPYRLSTSTFYTLAQNYNAPYIAMFGGCWTADLEHIAILKNILLMPEKGAIFSIGAGKLDNTGSEQARAANFFYAFRQYGAKTLGDAYIIMAIGFLYSPFNVYSKLNSFGDPTIEPYLGGKFYTTASHDNSFSDSLVVNTIPNARVLLYDGEFYVFTKSDNSGRAVLRYNNSQSKTLLLSVSKPTYVPYYAYVNYYPSNIIVDSIVLNADNLQPSYSYPINFYLTNISSNDQNVQFKVEFVGATPDSFVQSLNFNPNESKIINQNITIKGNAKKLLVKVYIDNKLIKSFSYSIEKVKLILAGVKWDNDSILFDIYNPSNVSIYNVEMRIANSNVYKTLDSIPSNANTNYTAKLPRISNNPKLVLIYNTKQDTYQLSYQLPLPSPSFYLSAHREGILIKFDTLDNNSRFYKIYRADESNGDYKFIGITNELSKIYLDFVDSFRIYYYKVSSLDLYYNEGNLSNYNAQSKNPNYSIYKPTYLPEQGSAPPLIGRFSANDPNKEVFMMGPIHMAFYNNQGIVLDGYPKEVWFRGLSGLVSDVDGDGLDEAIVSAQRDGKAYLLSIKPNKIDTVYESSNVLDISLYNRGIILADFNSDGLLEIALKTYYNNQRIMIIDPRTKTILNEFNDIRKGNFDDWSDISASDFDNDGKYELVYVDSLGYLHVRKFNGQEINNFPINIRPYLYNQNTIIYQFSSAIYLNQNKIVLCILEVQNNVTCLIVDINGQVLADTTLIDVASLFSLSLGNIAGDSIPEIILVTNGSVDNTIQRRRIILLDFNFNVLAQILSDPKDYGVWLSPASVVDNRLIISLARRVHILRYESGSLVDDFGSPIILADDTLPEGVPLYSPIFQDIDNDSNPEMFILQHSHPLYSFNLWKISKVEWNGNGANQWNTREYGNRGQSGIVEDKNYFIRFSYKKFAIEYNVGRSENYKLRVYDVSGRLICDEKGILDGKGYININRWLRSGIYIIDLKSDNYKFRTKVLKL